jgi:MSHA biogenesis protein MshK
MKLISQIFQPVHYPLKPLLIVLLGMTVSLALPCAHADTLKDPTQPPASLYSDTMTDEGQEAVSSPVLQSVIIGPQFRAAVINGKTVMLGKKYEQATLIKLDEHKAMLRNPDMTTQTLLMDYAIEKKIVFPVAASTATKIKMQRSSKPIVVSEK